MLVDVDNYQDKWKLTNKWPVGSFGSNTQVKTEPESIDVRLTLLGVDKMYNIEKESLSLMNLEKAGITNVERATRYNQATETKIDINKLTFKVKSLELLEIILKEDILLDCTGLSHKAEINVDHVKICENCLSYDHGSKGCKLTKICLTCSETGHKFTECKNKIIKCYYCKKNHISGSNKCKHTFEKNKSKNEFVWRFLVGQKISPTIAAALRLKEIPDNLHDAAGELIGEDDNQTEEEDKLFHIVGEYAQALVETKLAPLKTHIEDVNARLDQHEIMIASNTKRIEANEASMKDIKSDIKAHRDETKLMAKTMDKHSEERKVETAVTQQLITSTFASLQVWMSNNCNNK